MKAFHLLLIVPLTAIAPIAAWAADDPYAAQLFAQHCASCHEAAAGGAARIPAVSQLKAMTPTAILKTLETGAPAGPARTVFPCGARRTRIRHILSPKLGGHRGSERIGNRLALVAR